MTFEFNIIYTPGTVKYLSLFVRSLLKWSDASFRLVSNGCLPQERRHLQKQCQGNPRLEFWTIPAKISMPHSYVLNYLQAMTISDYFCIMDSDIFATGNFLHELTPHIKDHAGVFSGAPISVTALDQVLPESFQIMSGWHHRTDTGICLGSSFFAIYNNRTLTSVMQSTGVGFEEFRWHEIPAQFCDQLTAMGVEKEIYDTGKLLNLLIISQNHKLIYLDDPALCHIGGVSFLPFNNAGPQGMKAKLVSQMTNGPLRPILLPLYNKWSARRSHNAYKRYTKAEYQAIVAQRKRQRQPTRQYFFLLLQALFANRQLPDAPYLGEPEIDKKIGETTTKIIALYEEFA